MSRKRPVEQIDLDLYASLTDSQRAILDGCDPVSRPILLQLYAKARLKVQD